VSFHHVACKKFGLSVQSIEVDDATGGNGMEYCQGPRAETKQPKLNVPAGACDCHMHIFGPESGYPYTPTRSFTPPDASTTDYQRVRQVLGLQRTVVVQASVYGTDNRRTVSAVAELGPSARGIVMVNQDVPPDELRALADQGMRGTRFITTVKGGPSLDQLRGVAAKIAEVGWHIEMYIPRHLWSEVLPIVGDLPVPVVFDHMGGMMADTDENDPDFRGMLKLLEFGKCWVKLCGYRASVAGHPYADVAPLARHFIRRAVDRCVWGTDWPHTTITGIMPDDGDLLDLLGTWAPDAVALRKILVDNPARLYGFDPAEQ
jgi:predicted TIM-barrel fold metal-dependent hydrolase